MLTETRPLSCRNCIYSLPFHYLSHSMLCPDQRKTSFLFGFWASLALNLNSYSGMKSSPCCHFFFFPLPNVTVFSPHSPIARGEQNKSFWTRSRFWRRLAHTLPKAMTQEESHKAVNCHCSSSKMIRCFFLEWDSISISIIGQIMYSSSDGKEKLTYPIQTQCRWTRLQEGFPSLQPALNIITRLTWRPTCNTTPYTYQREYTIRWWILIFTQWQSGVFLIYFFLSVHCFSNLCYFDFNSSCPLFPSKQFIF